MNSLKYFGIPIAVLVAASSFHTVAISEAADTVPVNPILEELRQRLSLLEAEKASITGEVERNKARLELFQQQYPVITGGNSGEIKFDNSKGSYTIGAWEIVFQRMEEGAIELCEKLETTFANSNFKDVVLVSESDLQLPAVYIFVSEEQKRLQSELNKILDAKEDKPVVGSSSATTPIAAVGAIFNSAVSIAKFFRKDITLYPEETTVSIDYVKNKVAKCLKEKKINVNYPALFSTHVLFSNSDSDFLLRLQKMSGDRQKAELKILEIPAKSRPEKISALFLQIDKFMNDLLAVSSASPNAPLLSVIRGEAVQLGLEKNSPMLTVGIPQQGGISMISSSSWRSDRLFVGGGVIISYRLSIKGNIIDSGIISKVDPKIKRVLLE